MPIKRYKAEQIVTILRQIEVGIANGKLTPQACKEAEITVQTFYRWRKEYGGLKLDQAKRLKELEKENAKLKRVVAELSLEKQVQLAHSPLPVPWREMRVLMNICAFLAWPPRLLGLHSCPAFSETWRNSAARLQDRVRHQP